MRKLALGLAVAPLLAWGAVSEEIFSGVGFSASGHTMAFSRSDEFDPEAPAQNLMLHQTRLGSRYRQYSLGVEFTSQLPFDAASGEHKPFTLDKKYAVAAFDRWQVVLGDSHLELGRGLALSLYNDSVFGIDNTLEGANARYRSDAVNVGVFGGRVNSLKVPVALNPQTNPLLGRQVYLAGLDGKVNVGDTEVVGGHYLFAANRPDDIAALDRRWHTVGVSFAREGALDGVDAYLESNVLLTQRLTDGGGSLPNGYGTYGSVTWVPAPWRVKLEGKDYRDYRFEFRRPPTLEEDIVETINTQDVSAARLTTEYRFLEAGAFVKGSYLLGDDRLKKSVTHHGVLGGGFRGPGKVAWEVSAGYRVLPYLSDMTHGSIKAKVPTFAAQSVELGARRQFTRDDLSGTVIRTDRNMLDMTYNFSPKFNVSFGVELVPTNTQDLGKEFLNGGATLKMGAFSAKAFVGKTSGGTLCSGGVCRQVPPFTGGYLESTYSL